MCYKTLKVLGFFLHKFHLVTPLKSFYFTLVYPMSEYGTLESFYCIWLIQLNVSNERFFSLIISSSRYTIVRHAIEFDNFSLTFLPIRSILRVFFFTNKLFRVYFCNTRSYIPFSTQSFYFNYYSSSSIYRPVSRDIEARPFFAFPSQANG